MLIAVSTLRAEDVEIVLGKSYANDIYYDFTEGIVKSESKDNWDIAFRTGAQSAGVLINSQRGVTLWAVPSTVAEEWDDAIDTTGMTASWTQGVNSIETWDIGAFNLGKDGFENNGDFGWGYYDMSSHSVVGTQIFIIKLSATSYKKIMIDGLLANTYTIKWSDLDGQNDFTADIPKPTYNTKLLVYFDLNLGQIVDRDPETNKWALIFGKYTDLVSTQTGEKVPYIVTGVRTNPRFRTAKVVGMPSSEATAPVIDDVNYTYSIGTIGSDWKKLDGQTFTFEVLDSITYFVTKEANGTENPVIYKIVFTTFEGSSTGRLVFALGTQSSVEDKDFSNMIKVYPSVVSSNEFVNIEMPNDILANSLTMFDITGKTVLNANLNGNSSKIALEMPSLTPGIYYMSFQADGRSAVRSIIVE